MEERRQLLTDSLMLGQIIRKERRRQKMTQQALADLVGISRETLWNLESKKGNIKLVTALRLADLLGLNVVIEKRTGE